MYDTRCFKNADEKENNLTTKVVINSIVDKMKNPINLKNKFVI